MNKTYTFHVNGMHCQSCVFTTESELQEVGYITHAKTTLRTNSVEVTGDFGEQSPEEVATALTQVLAKHGYSLAIERPAFKRNWSDFKIAVPLAAIFAVLFVLLQRAGIINLVNTSSVTYATAAAIGLVASLSTCMAVVGGLVLSLSATFAKEGDRVKPQVLFHLGRLIAFFVLGGVIGAIGSAFALNTTGIFVLSLAVGLVMLILGINLLDIFPAARRFQLSMPKLFSKHALGVSRVNHTLTPFLIGVSTFFLPCGFTQSMQIYTLTTGTFIQGGLTMLAFALGTLPVLTLVSFSSFSIQNTAKSGIFFKTAGLVVILFALFNIINSLVVIGVVSPVFNF